MLQLLGSLCLVRVLSFDRDFTFSQKSIATREMETGLLLKLYRSSWDCCANAGWRDALGQARKEVVTSVVCSLSFVCGLIFTCQAGVYYFELFDMSVDVSIFCC
jgi:hypothetical protein